MTTERRIAELVEPVIDDLGFDLVRVMITGSDSQTLQIMAEPKDGRTMTVEDCAAISRDVSAVLDVEDPIAGAYDLEVSSPGIDRPLVRLGDFERFAGFDARIEMRQAIDGQRRYKGRLLGTEGEDVLIRAGENDVALPHTEIAKAKLLLTDELINATLQSQGG